MLSRVLPSYMPKELGCKEGLLIVVFCVEKETMDVNRSHEIVFYIYSHAINCMIHALVCVISLKRVRLCFDLARSEADLSFYWRRALNLFLVGSRRVAAQCGAGASPERKTRQAQS